MTKKETICVFCSSNKDLDNSFIEEARYFGNQIGKNWFDLIYGGCDVASMGAVARGVQEGGGAANGIITQHFIDDGLAYTSADELTIVFNSKGFFDELKVFLTKLYEYKVAHEKYKKLYTFVDKPEDGIIFLRDYFMKNKGII
ncbi:MAG: hypothetical protein AAB795_00985 [Patescibacteria group bacterium]